MFYRFHVAKKNTCNPGLRERRVTSTGAKSDIWPKELKSHKICLQRWQSSHQVSQQRPTHLDLSAPEVPLVRQGQDHNISEAWACLHLSHTGSASGSILESVSFHQWVRCSTLHWTSACPALIMLSSPSPSEITMLQ